MKLSIIALLFSLTFTLSTHAQLVPKDAVPEKVADGYKFTEGPALGPDGCIYFTDIPAELILKFDPENGETTTYVEKSGQANGLMFDGNGKLFACHHRFRMVTQLIVSEEGAAYVHFAGGFNNKKLNSPNDLAIDKTGNIYFTDPRYGNRDSMQMQIEGVYFQSIQPGLAPVRTTDGEIAWKLPVPKPLARIDDKLTRPNGIILSPDESILYVADNGANYIYAYDIASPGKVENKRIFGRINDGKGGGSDGMCIDKQGRLYATGHGKVWVFEPTGELVATIAVGKQTTNCTFGADGKTLYITANKGLYRITLDTGSPLEHGAPTLEIGLGKIEISADLPVPFSASATAIKLNRDNDPWQYQKGRVVVRRPARGGRRTTIAEIAGGESNLLIRFRLDAAELAAWAEKLNDNSKASAIGAVSEKGSFSCIGFATHQETGGSTMDIRPDTPITYAGLPKLEKNDTIYLYFEVAKDIDITGIAVGKQVFELNKALPVKQ